MALGIVCRFGRSCSKAGQHVRGLCNWEGQLLPAVLLPAFLCGGDGAHGGHARAAGSRAWHACTTSLGANCAWRGEAPSSWSALTGVCRELAAGLQFWEYHTCSNVLHDQCDPRSIIMLVNPAFCCPLQQLTAMTLDINCCGLVLLLYKASYQGKATSCRGSWGGGWEV